jgi:hypothetical protein
VPIIESAAAATVGAVVGDAESMGVVDAAVFAGKGWSSPQPLSASPMMAVAARTHVGDLIVAFLM